MGRGFAPIWDAAVPETDGTTGSEPGRPPDMGHWKYATLVIIARSFAPTPGENPGCLTDTRVADGMAAWPLLLSTINGCFAVSTRRSDTRCHRE